MVCCTDLSDLESSVTESLEAWSWAWLFHLLGTKTCDSVKHSYLIPCFFCFWCHQRFFSLSTACTDLCIGSRHVSLAISHHFFIFFCFDFTQNAFFLAAGHVSSMALLENFRMKGSNAAQLLQHLFM